MNRCAKHDTPLMVSQLLARWRRRGRGIWRVILVVIGYDDDFTYLYPGGLSKKFAEGLARRDCANDLGEPLKHVIVKEAKREN